MAELTWNLKTILKSETEAEIYTILRAEFGTERYFKQFKYK